MSVSSATFTGFARSRLTPLTLAVEAAPITTLAAGLVRAILGGDAGIAQLELAQIELPGQRCSRCGLDVCGSVVRAARRALLSAAPHLQASAASFNKLTEPSGSSQAASFIPVNGQRIHMRVALQEIHRSPAHQQLGTVTQSTSESIGRTAQIGHRDLGDIDLQVDRILESEFVGGV